MNTQNGISSPSKPYFSGTAHLPKKELRNSNSKGWKLPKRKELDFSGPRHLKNGQMSIIEPTPPSMGFKMTIKDVPATMADLEAIRAEHKRIARYEKQVRGVVDAFTLYFEPGHDTPWSTGSVEPYQVVARSVKSGIHIADCLNIEGAFPRSDLARVVINETGDELPKHLITALKDVR